VNHAGHRVVLDGPAQQVGVEHRPDDQGGLARAVPLGRSWAIPVCST
jgi:hypothetical protein